MGGGHSHDEDQDWSLPPQLRKYVTWAVAVLVAVTVAGLVWLWPRGETPSLGEVQYASGQVVDIQECKPAQAECQVIVVEVLDGPAPGDVAALNMQSGEGAPEATIGADVWLTVSDIDGQVSYGFADVKRDQALLFLVMLFAAAVVLLSRWKGVAALAGLAVSILLLAYFVLPALLQGAPPVAVAAFGASAIAMATMGLAHGFNMRTGVALIGTVIALLLTAFLGAIFTTAAKFTGVGGEDAFYLQNSPVDLTIDLRGLFLAGLVIGALGVLDDVTVTQAATVWEVHRARPHSTWRHLFTAGMRVGRDHVAATVNTLVLAYIGASLPLFLIIVMSETPLSQSLTTEFLAQEIVRSLVGSLGIIAAVPITTFAASWILTRAPESATEPAPTAP